MSESFKNNNKSRKKKRCACASEKRISKKTDDGASGRIHVSRIIAGHDVVRGREIASSHSYGNESCVSVLVRIFIRICSSESKTSLRTVSYFSAMEAVSHGVCLLSATLACLLLPGSSHDRNVL